MGQTCVNELWIREGGTSAVKIDTVWIRNQGQLHEIQDIWVRNSLGQAEKVYPVCTEDDPPCPNPPCPDTDFETWDGGSILTGDNEPGGGILNP